MSKNIKVAVQFFGNLRTVEKCYKSLQPNLFDVYDCDVFVHSWDSMDHDTQTWHKHKYKNNTNTKVSESLLKSYYPSIKAVKIENPRDINIELDGNFIGQGKAFSLFGVRCMYHSMEESNKLREAYSQKNSVNYDYVIIIRPDLKLVKPLCIENYLKHYSKNETSQSVFTSSQTAADSSLSYILNDESLIKGTDLIIFGSPKPITKLFKNNTLSCDLKKLKNKAVNYGPEHFIYKLSENNGLNMRITDYNSNTSFEIIRQSKRLSLKNIISLRIRKNNIELNLLPKMNSLLIASINLIGNKFIISFSIGRKYI